MTQTSHLKSPAITSLDTIPPFTASTGEGSQGYLREISGFVTPVAADAAGSTYQFVRIPTNAKVKSVVLNSGAQGAGAIQIGVYYSDSTVDGTAPANQGLVVPTSGVDFFASDVSLASAIIGLDEVMQNLATSTANNPALINTPLWQALGLTSDPGGYFDIVGTVHTTAVTTGGKPVSLTVRFVD